MRSSTFLSPLHGGRLQFQALQVLCLWLFTICSAQAQTFQVLYTFKGFPDGRGPQGRLMLDESGNVYGTTSEGGVSFNGTVFRLNPSGKETVLYNFRAGYGDSPNSVLVPGAEDKLYGTTLYGGAYNCGTVFNLDRKGNETVLHSFSFLAGECWPNALIRDTKGIFFGTTQVGGSGCSDDGCGVIFRMDAKGKETVLYRFTGQADGANPSGALVRDPEGNLYGTAARGGDLTCDSGYGCGTVFKLDTTGKETVLYSFTGAGGDGAFPSGGLARDNAGAFYGTTYAGGDVSCGYPPGCGTVFKVEPNGKETVLYRFTGVHRDGCYPVAGVVVDSDGNIFGTTQQGGQTGANCVAYPGSGVVFMLDRSGKETILHSFTGGKDGGVPNFVVLDAGGNVYGTAATGGHINCKYSLGYGCGTVFKLTLAGRRHFGIQRPE
jgi:uncharacterized repeat protein (TIGR03803 family)